MLTNKDGNDIGQFLYTPFGEMWVEEASTVDISHITRFFTNQQYDKESGLYYYNARYYDPHLGSFITPDPAMVNLNHYAYASANPIKYTDPTGLTEEEDDETTTTATTKTDTTKTEEQKKQEDSSKTTGDVAKKKTETETKQPQKPLDYSNNPNGPPKAYTPQSSSTKRSMPMNDPKIIAGFEMHKSYVPKSPSPGVDMTSADKRIFVMHDGALTYKDSKEKGYGFHAVLTYKGLNGEEIIETYAHELRPDNYQELLDKGTINVVAGQEIGNMSNSGGVYTKQSDGTYGPVTKEQREAGKGTHLHWDVKVKEVGGKFEFVDPIKFYK